MLVTVTGTLMVIALIITAVVNGWLPEFFVQGQGGTGHERQETNLPAGEKTAREEIKN